MRTSIHFKRWFYEYPELVCFDLDGTLVDSVPDITSAIDVALEALGSNKAGEVRVRGWVGFGLCKLIEQALDWAQLDRIHYEEVYKMFLQHYYLHVADNTQLYPNVKVLLEAFKHQNIPMALITNKPSVFIKPILDYFGITEYFAWFLGGDSLEEHKPSAMPLLYCSAFIEAKPKNCLMIGDSITDYRAANNAGFKCALVTYGYHQGIDLVSLGADVVMDDLVELLV